MMTPAQKEARRRERIEIKRLKERVEAAPHGLKRIRESELQAFIHAGLRKAAGKAAQ